LGHPVTSIPFSCFFVLKTAFVNPTTAFIVCICFPFDADFVPDAFDNIASADFCVDSRNRDTHEVFRGVDHGRDEMEKRPAQVVGMEKAAMDVSWRAGLALAVRPEQYDLRAWETTDSHVNVALNWENFIRFRMQWA
jgi:hypothetical protein